MNVIDVRRADPRLLDDVTHVVAELQRVVSLDPARVLLVGAGCRDIIHSSLGLLFRPTATSDTDLGIAIEEWSVAERIEAAFTRIGSNGIRYRIDGFSVDIVPFGGIENPDGLARPATREDDLVVFGYQDVYRHAVPLTLHDGSVIRMPQPAGYAALKMRAYIDRSPDGEDKDARDLALAAFWYQQSSEVADRLYAAGRLQVVEDRLVAGEPLEPHHLFGEQGAVVAELDVALAGNVS